MYISRGSSRCTAAASVQQQQQQQQQLEQAGRRAVAVVVAGSCSANITGFSLLELISKGVEGELSA